MQENKVCLPLREWVSVVSARERVPGFSEIWLRPVRAKKTGLDLALKYFIHTCQQFDGLTYYSLDHCCSHACIRLRPGETTIVLRM